jgi:acetyl-CoA synthetase
MARTIYGDHKRFLETYIKPYEGYYFTGDGAHVDTDGHFQITGRVDDVINVSGHRIGTAEIEEVLDEHHNVAESAVVGFPHDLTGK